MTQQVYAVKADYRNRVTDGRSREEGTDLDLTWRSGAEWQPHAAHRVEFGAHAQSLDATRVERAFAPTSTTTFVNADVDTWTTAGWAQYRWTPTARLSIAPVCVHSAGISWTPRRHRRGCWLNTSYGPRYARGLAPACNIRHPPSISHCSFSMALSSCPNVPGPSKADSSSGSARRGGFRDRSTIAAIPICSDMSTQGSGSKTIASSFRAPRTGRTLAGELEGR